MRYFTVFLIGLFLVSVAYLLSALSGIINDEHLFSSVYLEMGMGLIQWLHSGFLGFKKGSRWHKRYFWGATLYMMGAVFFLFLMLQSKTELSFSIGALVGLGLVIPYLMAGFYAFAQHRFFHQSERVILNSDPNVLDDYLPL